jgi:hypothetical protein
MQTQSIGQGIGLATAIISVLRQYGSVPIEFLAARLNRQPEELRECLESLMSMDTIGLRKDPADITTVELKQNSFVKSDK